MNGAVWVATIRQAAGLSRSDYTTIGAPIPSAKKLWTTAARLC